MSSNLIVGVAYDEKAAFDLAASFIRSGLTVDVFRGNEYHAESKAQAAVYNTESFFMTPDEEYNFMVTLFKSVPADVLCYLKSDSSLRGNIGAELKALMDGRELPNLVFVPALPKAKKYTEACIQYQIDSHGNKNLLADADKLIHVYSDVIVTSGSLQERDTTDGIFVSDCNSSSDFDEIVQAFRDNKPKALAGTGALGEKLLQILDLSPSALVNYNGVQGVLSLSTLDWKGLD